MSGDSSIFRTFCHISEYGAGGYAELHRMIAVSSPLVLWAPSSELLKSPTCRVTERAFLDLVENKHVRVIARHNWLFEPKYRNSHPWIGARWNHEVDSTLRRMALEDEALNLNDRRVAIGPDEEGLEKAERFLGDELNGHRVDQIYDRLTAPDANQHFPSGVIETAHTFGSDREGLVTRILRDAFNHDAAIGSAAGEAPFMLSPRESEFQSLLEEVHGLSLASGGTIDGPRLTREQFADLTREVLAILHHLESSRSPKLSSFLDHQEHKNLALWMGSLCRDLAAGEASTAGAAFRSLQTAFNNGRLKDTWADLFPGKMAVVSGLSTSLGVLDPAVSHQLSVLGAMGLATGLITASEPLSKRVGLTEVEFTGPTWPFIYAFDAGPRKKTHTQLKSAFDAFTPSR